MKPPAGSPSEGPLGAFCRLVPSAMTVRSRRTRAGVHKSDVRVGAVIGTVRRSGWGRRSNSYTKRTRHPSDSTRTSAHRRLVARHLRSRRARNLRSRVRVG